MNDHLVGKGGSKGGGRKEEKRGRNREREKEKARGVRKMARPTEEGGRASPYYP
jgi:hypothetical protein